MQRLRPYLQQELCQPAFGRQRVTKLQSGLPFCHERLFFSHFCCTDRKNILHLHSERPEDGHTVDVAQLVRASDCGSEGRGFEPLLPPQKRRSGKPERADREFKREQKGARQQKPYISLIYKAFSFLYDSRVTRRGYASSRGPGAVDRFHGRPRFQVFHCRPSSRERARA